MISLINMCFGWLPMPLFYLVSAVTFLFAIFVFFDVVELIFRILGFFKDILAGIFGKVVAFFV